MSCCESTGKRFGFHYSLAGRQLTRTAWKADFQQIWRDLERIELEPKCELSGKIWTDRNLVPMSLPGFWGVRWQNNRWDSKQFEISARTYLERFGEIRAYPAHRISGVTIDFLAGASRVVPYFHFKKIIMEKAFRTRKWQQIQCHKAESAGNSLNPCQT